MTQYSPIPLAYDAFGQENVTGKPPIIFLHGMSLAKESWEDIPQTVANKTKRTVYALDARNHGDTLWSDIFSFDSTVVDLIHFMDTHNIKKAALVGHSMGGVTAMRTAIKHPDRVDSIVIEDMRLTTPPPEILEVPKIYLTLAKNAVQHVPSGVSEDEAVKIIREYMIQNIPEVLKESANAARQHKMFLKLDQNGRYTYKANLDVIVNCLQNLHSSYCETEGVYEGPASFIYGELSPMKVPDDADNIKKKFPTAEIIGINDATHSVHNDHPEEFCKIIVDFFSRK